MGDVLAHFGRKIAAHGAGIGDFGSVAPIIVRHAPMTPGPSATAATSGPEVMNSTSAGKNGLPACSLAVLFGELRGDRALLKRHDRVAPCVQSDEGPHR